ncbi:type IV pilus biogenesis protein PilM [Pelotomaculum propionicicum]|uniref:type IV pilus biogenesis protein PilM n=1 Tax=Pelotomaculum propionicicum TaxID=258475 RepID=UPI003B7DB495
MERVSMKNFFRRFLPEKKHFTGVDIGIDQIKVAELEVVDGTPEVTALRMRPSPPGVWSDSFDEEGLVQVLKEVLNPDCREVITCIGSEKTVCRIVRFPRMSEKELWSAVKLEVQKYVPTPAGQLVIRYVRLDRAGEGDGGKRTGKPAEAGVGQRLQDVLLLAVPLATVYQYHGIFSRTGFTVAALDLQAFALWRIFGRNTPGNTAMVDIGAKTSHFVLLRDGQIRFLRLLPAGSENLAEITKELRRSLDYYSTHEKISVEKIILSGGISNPGDLIENLNGNLRIDTEVGVPDVDFTGDELYDPAYAVSVGLALREVAGSGRV